MTEDDRFCIGWFYQAESRVQFLLACYVNGTQLDGKWALSLEVLLKRAAACSFFSPRTSTYGIWSLDLVALFDLRQTF